MFVGLDRTLFAFGAMTDYVVLEEKLTKFLEEQDPDELDQILDLTVKMIKEYKHLETTNLNK